MDKIRKIVKNEKRFMANRYNGKHSKGDVFRKNSQGSYIMKKGSIPVMISAPHAVNHFREEKQKYADMYTGGLAEYLHDELGCHVMYATGYTRNDANYDEAATCDYKKELVTYIRDNDIKVLIDLHGSAKTREFAVEMGTIDEADSSLHQYQFIEDLLHITLEASLEQYLKEDGKVISNNSVFAASNPNTVTYYVSCEAKIPCIQLEINRLYRDPEQKERFMSLVEGFEKAIRLLGKVDWTASHIQVYRAAQSAIHFPQDKAEVCSLEGLPDVKERVVYLKTADCPFALCRMFERKEVKPKNESEPAKQLEHGKIYLTNRLIDQLLGQDKYEGAPVLLYYYTNKEYPVGQPKADVNEVTFAPDLFESMKQEGYNLYLLHNRETGSKMYVKPKTYIRGEKKAFLPRYFRQLLSKVQEDEDQKQEELKKVEVLPIPNTEKKHGFGEAVNSLEEKILNVLIRNNQIDMKVTRPQDVDDKNRIARLSDDIMKVLGVSENDKIEICFGTHRESVRVLESPAENIDMYIGIPASVRLKLGVMPDDIVSVRRDMKHTFIRNMNQQLFAIFGTVLTIITLSDNIYFRVIMTLIAIPFVVYVTFSEERVRVKGKNE